MARFQQGPEVCTVVGVAFAIHVGFCVVDDLVRIVGDQSGVGVERVGMNIRPAFNVHADDPLHFVLSQRVQNVQGGRGCWLRSHAVAATP